MRTLLMAVALIATPALAGELPINGVYGTPEACKYFAIGGAEGVIAADGGAYEEENFGVVTSRQMLSFESICDFTGDALGRVGMSCREDYAPPSTEITDWVDIQFAG